MLQGQLSLRTAVLSPESIVTLIQVNMEQKHTQLDSMFKDKSSNGEEHWQQVAVCSFCDMACLCHVVFSAAKYMYCIQVFIWVSYHASFQVALIPCLSSSG